MSEENLRILKSELIFDHCHSISILLVKSIITQFQSTFEYSMDSHVVLHDKPNSAYRNFWPLPLLLFYMTDLRDFLKNCHIFFSFFSTAKFNPFNSSLLDIFLDSGYFRVLIQNRLRNLKFLLQSKVSIWFVQLFQKRITAFTQFLPQTHKSRVDI